MNKKTILDSTIIIVVFVIAFYGMRLVTDLFNFTYNSLYLKIAVYYLWWIIPTVIICGFLFGFKMITYHIGLSNGILTGLVFAIITVMPMLISSALNGKINTELNITGLLQKTVFAGLMEEYLFRGYLFGLLFRKLKWGFVPASIIGAVIFASGHIYQGSSLSEVLGVFFVTFIGAIWFAWLYIEWNYNLWIAVFLHIFMNLSWTLFDISSNASGNLYANIFRIITIALTIIITIKYPEKKKLIINRNNLLINKSNTM